MQRERRVIFQLSKVLLSLSLIFLLYLFLSFSGSRKLVYISHPIRFFEESTFSDAIERVKRGGKDYKHPIIGAVVPHHLLPSFIIADLFKNLADNPPDTIILIGPNHYELGGGSILTSAIAWDTPFGAVEPDTAIVNDLVSGLAGIDESVMDNEHSMGGIMAFIKYYLPKAKVVPIILSRTAQLKEIDKLADYINAKLGRAVVVGSVDFSHYQIQSVAEKNDELTLSLMKQKNYEGLIGLSNAYIDSPPSIVAILKVMERKGISGFNLVYHTNAGIINKYPHHEVTSYFSFTF